LVHRDNVVLDEKHCTPIITKDGVTVAKEIDLKDAMEKWARGPANERESAAEWTRSNLTIPAVVVAALRVKQLRRGSKPRVELDDKKHKDTSIPVEEVRRGLISFTQSALPHVHDPMRWEI
jgi:chaperonin GroEL